VSEDGLVPYDLTAKPGIQVRMPPGWKFRNLLPRPGEPELPAWLRQRVAERLYLAQHAIRLGNAFEWTEQSSGVLVFAEPTETDTWHGTWAMGDSSVTRLMEANDPRDTIARCDAELAILDELAAATARRKAEAADYGAWAAGDAPAVRPAFSGPDVKLIEGLERAVRLLGWGYRHRPGYREEWRP